MDTYTIQTLSSDLLVDSSLSGRLQFIMFVNCMFAVIHRRIGEWLQYHLKELDSKILQLYAVEQPYYRR